MPEDTRSLREQNWLGCFSKVCCSNTWVPLTGRDVYRIAATLSITPKSFVLYAEDSSNSPLGFALDQTEVRHQIYLAKQLPSESDSPQQHMPCAFLVRLGSNRALCGLGETRPMICQTYPYTMQDGKLAPLNNGGCNCRIWTLDEVDMGRELALQTRAQADQEEYAAIVAEWNRRVMAYPGTNTIAFDVYLNYLIARYAAITEN